MARHPLPVGDRPPGVGQALEFDRELRMQRTATGQGQGLLHLLNEIDEQAQQDQQGADEQIEGIESERFIHENHLHGVDSDIG